MTTKVRKLVALDIKKLLHLIVCFIKLMKNQHSLVFVQSNLKCFHYKSQPGFSSILVEIYGFLLCLYEGDRFNADEFRNLLLRALLNNDHRLSSRLKPKTCPGLK